MRLFWVLFILISQTAFAEKSDMNDVILKKSPVQEENAWKPYASIEFRHYTNTYYDSDDYLLSQEPSFHTIGQIGVNLYSGLADLYGTFGIIKKASTQQILQRRPQIELDVYPIYNDWYSLTQYTIVETPFSDSEYYIENKDSDQHGSIITVGIAQALKYKTQGAMSSWKFELGADAWTKLYSRKQDKELKEEDEEALLLVGRDPEKDKEDAESPELNSEIMAGATIRPSILPDLGFMASVHFTQEQTPRYSYNEEIDELDYTYKKKKTSHYRVRLSYKINEATQFINDFYHFHDGFFEAKTSSPEDRRLRNIARVQIQL